MNAVVIKVIAYVIYISWKINFRDKISSKFIISLFAIKMYVFKKI